MAAGPDVAALVDRLIDAFNRRSLDLPAGCFTRHTQFLLNGVPFEDMLGRPPGDPLVLMLARGAAGYRFTVKALQHALPDAQIVRGAIATADADAAAPGVGARLECWISGHFRGSGDPAELLATVELTFGGAAVERANAILDPEAVARLRQARLDGPPAANP